LEILVSSELLSLDIETAGIPGDPRSGLDPHKAKIRLVQFYSGTNTVYVFDCFKDDVWNCLFRSTIWQLPLVAHNAIFELKHLNHAGIHIPNIGCTMLQHNALNSKLPSLKVLVEKYLGHGLSKECQVSDWTAEVLTNEQLEYAALDAVVTYKIAHIQACELAREQLKPVYLTMKNAQQAIANMEYSGILFDLDKHKIIIDRWKEERNIAIDNLKDVLPGVNLNSGKQVADWLRNTLNAEVLETWPVTPKGQLKTDISTFSRYPELEATKPLLIYKNLSKKLSTYGEKYRQHVNTVTGRIHGNYRLGGNITGRLPCSNPNLQQVPRDQEFRSLFIAPPSKLLLVADYSQIQLRIAALLANDQNMLEVFAAGEDLHKSTAAAILAIPATNVTKEQRQMGKAVSFGLLFGQGAKGLARYAKTAYGVDMSEEEAENARSTFFKTYPALAKWQRTTGFHAKRQMKVVTPGGRIRDFTKEAAGYKFTEALNTPIQGAESEILMNTFSLLPSRLIECNLQLVNTIHDELVFEISENDAKNAKQIIEQIMTDGFLQSFPKAIDMTNDLVEAHTGPNWFKAK